MSDPKWTPELLVRVSDALVKNDALCAADYKTVSMLQTALRSAAAEIERVRAAGRHVLEMTTPIPDMVSVYVTSTAIADLREAMGEDDE